MKVHRESFKFAEEFRNWLKIEGTHIPAPIWEVLQRLKVLSQQKKMGEAVFFCDLVQDLLQTQQTLLVPQGNPLYVEGILNGYRAAINWAEEKLYSAEQFLRCSAEQFDKSGVGNFKQ